MTGSPIQLKQDNTPDPERMEKIEAILNKAINEVNAISEGRDIDYVFIVRNDTTLKFSFDTPYIPDRILGAMEIVKTRIIDTLD